VPPGGRILVETKHLHAAIATEGYVSGVAAGSFVDTKTGARDLGFGLSIVDFLLEPGRPGLTDPRRAVRLRNTPCRPPRQTLRRGPPDLHAGGRLPATVIRGKGSPPSG
jgi:hypothetical protein